MTGWVFGIAGFLLVGLVVVALANRMLRNGGGSGGGIADGLGNFIDVFDPARARADRDLKSWENQGEVLPSPDDDDERPMRVDYRPGVRRVRIRRVTKE